MALDSDHWSQDWLIQTSFGDGDDDNDGNAIYEEDDTQKGTAFSHCL